MITVVFLSYPIGKSGEANLIKKNFRFNFTCFFFFHQTLSLTTTKNPPLLFFFFFFFFHLKKDSIMSRGPEEWQRRLQLILQSRGNGQRFNFGGGGGRGSFGLASILLLGAGTLAVSNSLFNGEF